MAHDIKQLPRIAKVLADPNAMAVRINWKNDVRKPDDVVLLGWIASGGDLLAPLRDPARFRTASSVNFGAAVGWANDDDLTIDAMHLAMLADEQRQFTKNDLRRWQTRVKLSNTEAAQLIGVSLSTWNAYKAGENNVPRSIGMLLRSIERDPLLMQAHLRPSQAAGRPRRHEAGR